MGARHQARRLALQALYALDLNPGTDPSAAVSRAVEEHGGGEVDWPFLDEAAAGTWQHRGEIDAVIQAVSRRWRLDRMDRVDKGILRLAAFELLHCPDNPTPVILDESIELAKEFGTPDSPSFVNGILDRIAHEQRRSQLDR